ncbi:MAG TPA: oligosaccharide flippase family protein [Rubrobacter sp.]
MSDESLQSESGYDAGVKCVAREVGVGSAGQGVGRLLGYATHASVAWMYGPAQLGFYALGITVVQVASILSQLGMDNGVVRYVAHHGAGGDTARVRGTILQSLAVTLALSLTLSVLLFAGAGYLAESVFGKPFLATMFRALAVGLPFLTFMSMALWATQGFGTLKYAAFVGQAARPLLNLVLLVFFYLVGVQILGAVAAYVISMALGAALALASLRRVFPGLLAGKAEYEGRELSVASAPMIVANVTQYSNLWTAVVVLGVFEPVPTVGVYSAAARTAALSSLVLISFAGVFSPLAAGLYRQERLGELGRLYADVSRWAFTGALAFFLVTALFSRDVMLFFGEEFAHGWPVVVVISAAQLFNSSVGPTARLLAMTGHQKAVMVSTVGSAIAAVALNFLLVPHYGVGGAAAATAAALVLANGSSLIFVRRRLGFWPYGPRYVKPLLAGFVAAAVTLGIRALLPTIEGLPALLLFAPIILVIFACALVSLGLYPSDRRFLASFGGAMRDALGREPAR